MQNNSLAEICFPSSENFDKEIKIIELMLLVKGLVYLIKELNVYGLSCLLKNKTYNEINLERDKFFAFTKLRNII